MKVALYARVSTKNQEVEEQEEMLTEWAENNGHEYTLYSEQVSSIEQRPKFEELMQELKKYDAVAVRELDRFGRSTVDILDKMDLLIQQDVGFRCLEQPLLNIDPGEEQSPLQEAVMELMSVFASFERKMIRKRMDRGYQEALEEGRVGRPKELTEEQEDYVWRQYQRGHSYNTIRALVNDKFNKNISKSPVQRVVEERKED